MNSKTMIGKLNWSALLSAVFAAGLFSAAAPLSADDTEIYETIANTNAAERPRVLIIMDDSGSMDTIVEGQRPAYDPTKNDYDGGIDGAEFDRIYWSTDGEPPSDTSSQWFNIDKNRCASASSGLSNQGFFQTQNALRWRSETTETTCQNICSLTGQPVGGIGAFLCLLFGGSITQECETNTIAGSWSTLTTSENDPPHVECQDDVINDEAGNGTIADGFPKDNVDDADVYSAATAAESDVSWNNTSYTLYSANYVDYWNDDSLIVDRTRMEIAQQVISDLVAANTSVDFALATFNDNDDGAGENGGRIIHRLIPNMDATQRQALVDMIEDDLDADGWTPLCETYYEVYRYLAGETVLYGDDRDTGGNPDNDLPPRDLLAESNGTYIQPTGDCAFIYVILMTDGLPTYDTDANSAIELLTGETCQNWPDDISGNGNPKNCLPELAKHMANTDLDGDASNGDQFAITYTIGFETDQALLSETANADHGKGEYYVATSADALAQAFQEAVLDIFSDDTTFTSPATTVDSFARTRSLDVVYYAMFKPDARVDWAGNVKKFKVATLSGEDVVVDKNGVAAFDATTNAFKATASSYWSNQDGGLVTEGGVGALLAGRVPSTRTIYSNTGTQQALELFNLTNLTPDAFGLGAGQNAAMWALFGVNTQADFETVVAWAQGYKDGDTTAGTRDWILGDVLHANPRVINYGAINGKTVADPDLRFLVATNAGFVHMFSDDDGGEDWAFTPKEFVEIHNQRRVNAVSNDNVYGMDLTPVIYVQQADDNPTINSAAGDKVYAYFGMRRGGRGMYALDISDPDAPAFLWRLVHVRAGASELGLTFSRPVVTTIPGYSDNNGNAKPVVIIGAGYDLNKDASGVGTADSMGRGIFVLDAATGAIVRSITPGTGTSVNLQDARLTHSVPAEVAVLDSTGDAEGRADRIYFADTGGNIWRVDMAGPIPGAGEDETWRVTHFGDFNDGSVAGDRRFFNQPDIVRTALRGQSPYDLVLIGTGDRTNPLATDVENWFYSIRDPQTLLYDTDPPTAGECDPSDPNNPLPLDNRCFLPITHGALYDITDDPLNDPNDPNAPEALAGADGWKFELENSGEKNLSAASTLGGEVIFTTFSPETGNVGVNASCEPAGGQGRRYTIDILTGAAEEELLATGEIPDEPSFYYSGSGKGIAVVNPQGTAADPNDPDDDGSDGSIEDLGVDLPGPYGNYWYSGGY